MSHIEQLEDRRLFNVTVTVPVQGYLYLLSDNAPDTIKFRSAADGTWHVPDGFPDAEYDKGAGWVPCDQVPIPGGGGALSQLVFVDLGGGDGNDTIEIDHTFPLGPGGIEVKAEGHNGNDTLTSISGGAGGAMATVKLDGGAGNDTLTATAPWHDFVGGDGNDDFFISGLDNPMSGGWNDLNAADDAAGNTDRLYLNGIQATPALIGGNQFGGQLTYDFVTGKHTLNGVQLNI